MGPSGRRSGAILHCFFELEHSEAKKIRGRSKILFNEVDKQLLQSIDKDDNHMIETKQAKWLRQQAEKHTMLGNKLINVARRIRANESIRGDRCRCDNNRKLIKNTLQTYQDLCTKNAKQSDLQQSSKDKIAKDFVDFFVLKRKRMPEFNADKP